MKSHWDLVVVSVLLIGFCGFVILPTIWDRFYILHPTPETESTLLKTYNPEHVIELFKWNQTSGYGRRSGAGAGRKFVTHTVGFDFHFAMRSEKWIPLMNALRDDASAQLLANDAKILHQSGDPHAGFHFDYQIGKSTGTLTILPLTIEHPQRVTPLCPGIVDVNSTIEQTETWFPKLKSRVAADLPIGSGEIESGHRYVFQDRLKIAGSWWKVENLQNDDRSTGRACEQRLGRLLEQGASGSRITDSHF